MLYTAVEETAAVGVCKIAAVCEFGVVGNGGALDAACAECAVVSLAAVVIYIGGEACLVELPVCGKVLPLWVEAVDGIVPETVVVGRQYEVPHSHLVYASKETATEQQWRISRDRERLGKCAALPVGIVHKQAYGVAVEQ